jgi:hypothetical protein
LQQRGSFRVKAASIGLPTREFHCVKAAYTKEKLVAGLLYPHGLPRYRTAVRVNKPQSEPRFPVIVSFSIHNASTRKCILFAGLFQLMSLEMLYNQSLLMSVIPCITTNYAI